MADKHSGRLAGWSDAMRLEFNLRRARGYKINASYDYIVEKYEDAEEYRPQTMYTYCKSLQGLKEYEQALEQVREEAKEKMYSHRGSRLDALIEVAEKLMLHFRLSTVSNEMVKLAGEIRSCLGEIRQEVDPYGLEHNQVQSHFEKLLGGFAGLGDKKQNMILEEAFWLKPSTTQTESN